MSSLLIKNSRPEVTINDYRTRKIDIKLADLQMVFADLVEKISNIKLNLPFIY